MKFIMGYKILLTLFFVTAFFTSCQKSKPLVEQASHTSELPDDLEYWVAGDKFYPVSQVIGISKERREFFFWDIRGPFPDARTYKARGEWNPDKNGGELIGSLGSLKYESVREGKEIKVEFSDGSTQTFSLKEEFDLGLK